MALMKNKISISLDPAIYPLEAIYGAAYVFIGRAYLFLERNADKDIVVNIKGKQNLTEDQMQALKGEFLNELLNCALRNTISKRNQKIREEIVTTALTTSFCNPRKKEPAPDKKIWKEDTLGIALPWEKKYK